MIHHLQGPQFDDCSPITNLNTGNGWMMIDDPNQDYLVKCYDGDISLYGQGTFLIRTSVINTFKYGLFDISNSDFTCTSNSINGCGSLSNKIQLISFRGPGTHTITGTEFRFCGVNPYKYIKENNTLPDDWDPSLIYITGNSVNVFDSIKFLHKKEGSPHPYELRPTRPIRLEGDCSLNINSSTFYNSSCFTEGSFLHLGSTRDISISSCDFEECSSEGGRAHAIYITDQNKCQITIEDCMFLDCGKNSKGHVICCKAPGLIFSRNNISFTNTNCSGCINCIGKGKYHFIGNYFSNARMSMIPDGDAQYKSVGINYEGDSNFQDEEDLVIDENHFRNIIGSNYGRCLSLQVQEGKLNILTKNIIESCALGGFCIKIMQRKAIDTFELNGWEFRNNIIDDSFGGGAGIWIENEAVSNNMYTYNYTLIIKDCIFENNSCFRRGGGFQIGYAGDADKDKYVTRVEVQISGCTFEKNTANEEGGALAIQTNYPLTITDCRFINNSSLVSGGAIFIGTFVPDPSGNNQQMPYATITDCEFIDNFGNNAHCIYIHDGPKTPIEITYCVFVNNFNENSEKSACVLSNSIELTVKGCYFINDDLEHSSGGVNVTSRSTLIISGTDFIHCNAGNIEGSYGGGIGYCSLNSNDVSRNEYIEITDCTFDGNGGANGAAIGLKPFTYPVISDIKIKNHVLTNGIFFIFFQSETEGDFILNKVKFEHNSFDSEAENEYGGSTGIWISESKDIDYTSAFNLVFERCDFLYNRSPENGGAISYGGSPLLQSIELTFENCIFRHNICDGYYGGACKFETNKPVSIISCIFDNNTAVMNSETESSGGAIFIGETVKSILINDCNFSNCFAHQGSFIFTNGSIKDISISRNLFSTLLENQDNSICIEIDSQIDQFIFDSNTFYELKCISQYGGSGLHIINNAQCEISKCKFINCIGNGEESGMIRIPEESNSNSHLIFTLCEFNNEHYTSARAISIVSNSLVKFDACKFLSYDVPTLNGAVVFSRSTSSAVFSNCTFLGLKGKSLMEILEAESIEIYDCQFSSCIVGESLIETVKVNNFNVSNCTFSNDNDAIRLGDFVANGMIYNNSFKQCTSSNGVIYIIGSALECNIFENIFTECQSNYDGLAIYIYAGNLINIHNCRFNDNYNRDTDCYTIYSRANNLNFCDSIIEYSDDIHGCGLKIGTFSTSSITNIQFRNLHRPSAIKYGFNSNNQIEHSITVTKCLFTNFQMSGNALSGYQYSCFQFGDNLNVEFINNTIEYHKLPASNWDSLFIGRIENKISNCIFSHNEVSERLGGGTGIDFSGANVQIINCQYYCNHALCIKIDGTLEITECQFKDNYAGLNQAYESNGGSIIVLPRTNKGKQRNSESIDINNCTFFDNKAIHHGGAIYFHVMKKVTISNCLFENNRANDQYSSTKSLNSNSFDDKSEGRGGAIFINPSNKEDNSFMNQFSIENCTFKNNSAFDGYSIYIEGFDLGTEFIIRQNTFVDNHMNNETNKPRLRGVITSEILDLYGGKVEDENEFIILNPITVKKLLYVENDKSSTIIENSQKITQLKSYSLTCTNMRSVSFLFSYFESYTYIMSFNSIDATYELVISNTKIYSYFPYIIHYLSPLYVSTFFPVVIDPKQRLTKEQLIGISCGSACVFFLILGIIILSIQKKNQDRNQVDEYYDISYSSELEYIEKNKENNRDTVQYNPRENDQSDNDQSDFVNDMSYSTVWI